MEGEQLEGEDLEDKQSRHELMLAERKSYPATNLVTTRTGKQQYSYTWISHYFDSAEFCGGISSIMLSGSRAAIATLAVPLSFTSQ